MVCLALIRSGLRASVWRDRHPIYLLSLDSARTTTLEQGFYFFQGAAVEVSLNGMFKAARRDREF